MSFRNQFFIIAEATLITLLITGCGSSGSSGAAQYATATSMFIESETREASYFLTETALPPRTPEPRATPDLRSQVDKCVQSGQGIRYVILEEGVSAVSLTWKNDTGGTDQGDYKAPFCKIYSGFKRGSFLYISAQISRPTSGAGNIKCRIYDGHTIIAEANASGFAAIATCSGTSK